MVAVLMVWLFPIFSHAAVIINEVAWMGTADSANDEWIELYNDADSSVSLDGWVLTDEMNLDIELAGTVGQGGYAVLERTDDSSAPGSAFLIYTGALTNAGATLKLLRDDGGVEDQVAGGENWENIGGDNVTKETAQYTSSGWVTGAATPGKENVPYEPEVEQDDEPDTEENEAEDETGSVDTGDISSSKVQIVVRDWELDLTLTAPKYAYVHQPVTFTVEPEGIPKVLLNSVQNTWNMGDLSVHRGNEVVHQYEYPGTYVVVVDGEFKEHNATLRHKITVLPVSFSLTTNSSGDLQVNNNSKYEVDLSGYSMRGDKTVVFPDSTILLPNATLTIPKERLGAQPHAWLMDQAHAVVASTMSERSVAVVEHAEVAVVARKPQASVPPQPVAIETDSNFTFSSTKPEPGVLNPDDFIYTEPKKEKQVRNTATVNQAQVPIPSEKLPYLGLVGVLSLGILALYATRVR